MPYIVQARREALEHPSAFVENVGELTYLYTRALLDNEPENVYAAIGSATDRYLGAARSFTHFAEVLGALTAAHLEDVRRRGRSTHNAVAQRFWLRRYLEDFYEGIVAPYEDTKIKENGDVEGYA